MFVKTDLATPRRLLPVSPWSIGLSMTILLVASGATGRAAPLDEPVQATFQRLPLRTLLERLQATTGVPLILARQIDPTQPVSLDCRGEPLRNAVERLAGTVDAELAILESSAWLVPAGSASRFTAADQLRQQSVRRLPPSGRRQLAATAVWSWPAGATPATLLTELVAAATANGQPLRFSGLETEIPHDHLAAGSLPALSLAERFDLVAMQYGLRVDWQADGGPPGQLRGRLVPLPEATDSPPGVAAATRRPRRPDTRRLPPANPANSRYTLRVAAPFDELLAAVAKQLQLTATIDRPALRRQGIDPREIVRLEVANVDRDGLLDAIVSPLHLRWKIDKDSLTVTTAPAAGITP
jgi:hypothetical protein